MADLVAAHHDLAAFKGRNGDATIRAELSDGELRLDWLEVPNRGQGRGTAVLRGLIELAERHGLVVRMRVGDDRVRRWCERLGLGMIGYGGDGIDDILPPSGDGADDDRDAVMVRFPGLPPAWPEQYMSSNSGWLHLSGDYFSGKPGDRRGHMSCVVLHPTVFGFASLDEALAASELGSHHDLSGKRTDYLCGVLDGDEGLWRTLYDRGWIRVVHNSTDDRYGIVVESEAVARRAVRHLANRFGAHLVDVDLYDRPSGRVHTSYRLDGDALDRFLRNGGRLRSEWMLADMRQEPGRDPEPDPAAAPRI